MEQIYYTQCPIGYGLGASNGFQVKRLSPGYPVLGDFRHLGLRAYLAGTRSLAPSALRYRIGEGGVAEVALLTPRTHEYETERGLWGRPGGHFAHGLRLDAAEMTAIRHCPAGLFGQALWRRSDPVPSRGQPPDPIDAAWPLEPTFSSAAALASRFDRAWLAALLAALATVTRDGRTLVLVDRPDRLADHCLLLTLAFPSAWRGRLTFSTYHDRPDELPGFRLQGTAPDPRLNRQALRTQGFLAEMTSGEIDPKGPIPRWALTLANWLVEGSDQSRDAWEATDRRMAGAIASDGSGSLWSDDWLDSLYDLPGCLQLPVPLPTGDPEWSALGGLADWARGAGLGRELIEARGASWWLVAASDREEARRALVAHLALLDETGEGSEWGKALAPWFDRCPKDRRAALLGSVLEGVPGGLKPAIIRSLLANAAPDGAREALRWLKSQPGIDPLLLLPLEVRGVSERRAGDAARRFWRDVLARAVDARASLKEVLDALADETAARPAHRSEAILAVCDVLAAADDRSGRAMVRWALDTERAAEGWVAPFLRMAAASLDGPDKLMAVSRWVERAQRGAFASTLLGVASEPNAPDEIFRWGIETRLLPIAEPERPHDPSWPAAYLDRMPSGLDLIRRLFTREFRDLGVKAWLDAARKRGELSTEQVGRIEGCLKFARALKAGDARALLRIDLPAVAAEERGALLSQVLSHVGTVPGDAFWIALESCRAAWPDGFEPGAEGLAGIAAVLADQIMNLREYPEVWLARVSEIITRLGQDGSRFEPDGLAAEMLAASTRQPADGFSPWRLRACLLRDDSAWRALAADIGHELAGQSVPGSLKALERWDRDLAKGVHSARFFEVWLNACGGPALAACVSTRIGDLKTLAPLSWWRWREWPEARDDIREGFARLAPMAPLAEETFTAVQAWMRSSPRPGALPARVDDGDLVAIEESAAVVPVAQSPMVLSEPARTRWRCLEALTTFSRSGLGGDARWQAVESWSLSLPLGSIAEAERYLFLAWLIFKLEGADGVRIARLANWLVKSGMTDVEKVTGWAESLGDWAEIAVSLRLARADLVAELKAEWRTVLREARERGSKPRESGSPTSG